MFGGGLTNEEVERWTSCCRVYFLNGGTLCSGFSSCCSPLWFCGEHSRTSSGVCWVGLESSGLSMGKDSVGSGDMVGWWGKS